MAAFDKDYFLGIRGELDYYQKHYRVPLLTLALSLYGDHEFNVARILKITDDLLMFAYYDAKKQEKLPDRVRRETGDMTAFPAVTVRYSDIRWVEFNPGIATGSSKAGFQADAVS